VGVLILTGPSAAGKKTIAAALAALRSRLAIIDVDVVRAMAIIPAAGGGNEAEAAVNAAAVLARAFVADGLDVVLVDVVSEESARLYRQLLPDTRVVQLLPAHEEVVRRYRMAADGSGLSDAELEDAYRAQEALTDLDVRLDNTTLSPEEAADQLSGWL
jgi:hypothetical protein